MSINQFKRLASQSVLLYALFLLPTALLLTHTGLNDLAIARAIEETWQAGFWQFPGLTSTNSRIVLDVLEIGVIGLLTWFFWQGHQLLKKTATAEHATLLPVLWRWALLGGLVLIAVVPFHSSDLYGYINRGIQQSLYHTNPYLTPVADIVGWRNEPLFHQHWQHNPCPYGFFFAWLTNCISASHQFITIFLGFKTLNLLLLLGTTALIYSLAKQLKQSQPLLSAYWFGVNPLVLLHVMGNGHNDILLVFLLLLSVQTLLSTRWAWLSIPLLTLSILTKYASVLALPFVLVYFVKTRQFKALMPGLLIGAGLLYLLATPYLPTDGQAWPWNALLDNAGKPQHSIIAMLGRLIYYPIDFFNHDAAKAMMKMGLLVLKPLFLLGFAWLCIREGLRFLKASADSVQFLQSRLIQSVTLLLTVLVAFVSAKFHPWYPVMFLPLALLLPTTHWLRRFGMLFSLFQIAGFTLLQNLHIGNVILLTLLPLWLSVKDAVRPTKPVSLSPSAVPPCESSLPESI